MDFQTWKHQARSHMEIFLISRGWPWRGAPQEKVNDAVMRLCREMFMSLDRVGLIPQGFTYAQFYKAAYDKYQASRKKLL